jgi:WS/DGAT/MGAT family acyltransferase
VRDEAQVEAFVAKAVERWGRVDVVVNNASAINLAPIADLEPKRYDLMLDINVRGTFVLTRAALPHLRRSDHAHVLTLSPPLSTDPRWLKGHAAYTVAKMGMSMLTLGVAEDEREHGVGANCLWPRTMIATAAVQNLLGGDAAMAVSRAPEIVADAAKVILERDPREATGNTYIDDEVLGRGGRHGPRPVPPRDRRGPRPGHLRGRLAGRHPLLNGGTTMQQLTSLDAMFLALETDRNYGHVGSLAIVDPSTTPAGKVTLGDVKQLLDERLHLIPPFTSRLAKVPFNLDWPYWVPDDHFDLGYHVRELALPEPGSMEQLAEQTARIYSRRLDRSRPLWEFYLIHGLPEGRVALVTKIHHSAVDGMSGSEILHAAVRPHAGAARGRAAVGQRPGDRPPPGGALVLKGLAALPRWPMTAATRLGRLLPHVDVVPSLLGAPGSETISRTLSRARKTLGRQADAKVISRPRNRPPVGPYGGRVSPHRIFGLGSVPLDDVKRVKNALGVKVNDVIVSITAGAIREHLQRHGELPDEPLVAQIPVSVRTEEERGTFGNQVSIMAVQIPTHSG